MDRSVGTHALLEESWTTPWLDDGTFPYWPEAARMGNLEEFLWWLQVQDKERAALVVRHAQEFKKVYSFITRELTRTHNSNFSSSGSSGSTSSASGSVRDGSSTVRRASNTSAGMAAGGVGLGVFGSRRDHASYLPRSCTAKSNNGGTDKGDQEQLGWSPSGAAEALPSTATRRSRSADGASSGSSIPAHLAQRVQRRRQSDTRRNDNKTTVSHVASMPGGTASWPLSAGGVVRRSSGFASIDNASYPPAATERSCPQADVAVRTAAVNSVPSISNEPRGTRAVTVFSSSLMAEPRSEHVGRSGSGLRRRNNKVSWVDGVNISSHLNSESINALGVNMGAKPSLEESKRQERSGREVTVVETHTIVAGGEVAAGRMGVPVPKPAGTRSATTNRWEIGRGGVFDPRQPLPQNSAVEGAAVSGRPSFTRPDDGRTAGTIINAAVGAGSRTGRWQTSQGIDGASGDGEGGRNNHGVRRRASADGTERTSSSSCLEDFQPSTPTQPKSAFSRDELVQHSRELSSSSAPAILVPPPQRSLHHRWRAQRQQARQKLLKEEEQHEKRVSRSLSNALVHEDDRGGEGEQTEAESDKGGRHVRPPGRESSGMDGWMGTRLGQNGHGEAQNTGHAQPGRNSSRRPWGRAPAPTGVGHTQQSRSGSGQHGSEGWLRMRDPVSHRQFYFDPETRAAEWEDGEVMDTSDGMGLGLLSKEERERLKRRFERRQRRSMRGARAGGGGGGVPTGLREQVLRRMALEGGREEKVVIIGEQDVRSLPEEEVSFAEVLRSA